MKREQYLKLLEERMNGYDSRFTEDIIESFRTHFIDGEAEGKTDEEIIEHLGSVDEVMENVRELRQENTDEKSRRFERNISEGVSQISSAIKDLLSSIGNNLGSSMQFSSEYIELDYDSQLNGILVNADDVSCDLKIKGGDSLGYSFTANDSGIKVRTEKRDDRMCFWVENASGKRINSRARLSITLPDYIDNVYVNSTSGDSDIRDMELSEVIVHSSSGDVSIGSVGGNSIIFKSVSGDLNIDECEFSRISVQTTSGDIQIESSSGDVLAKTVSGDCEITEHAGRVTAETVSGDIEISMEEAYSVSGRSKSGDIEVEIEDGDFTASLHTLSGDIDVSGVEHVSNGRGSVTAGNGSREVMLSTLSGDISVSD